MALLAFNPQRLPVLALMTRAAADELAVSAQGEPYCEDAAAIARAIGGGLEGLLVQSLRNLLLSTSMTEWQDVFTPMTVDELLARLVVPSPDPSVPFVLDGSQFSLSAAVGTGGNWREDVNGVACVGFPGGTYHGGGYVTDHLGNRYAIVVPRVETEDGDVYTADALPVDIGDPSVATLGGSDPGWEVVGCATGVARFQKAPSFDEGLWGFLAGTTSHVQPLPPNSGLAQITVSGGAAPSFADEVPVPGPIVVPQSGGTPDPLDNSRGAVLDGRTSLAVTVSHGGVMAAAMDNQTQRAYQVIFEENADGRRRARVQTFTLAHDGAGGTAIVPEYVYVDATGRLISETISYGSPYDPDAEPGKWRPHDVIDLAYSGEEPISYPVPGAVFP